MIVYLTVNTITGSYYVGVTNGNNHSQPGIYLGSGRVLKLAFKKYGRENFRRFTLEQCTDRNHAALRESWWITKCKAKWPDKRCYNLTVGGENGEVRSAAANAKISKALQERSRLPGVRKWQRQHALNTLVKWSQENEPWNKKLSSEDIRYIKQQYNSYKKTATELAKELGVSVSCVCQHVDIKKKYRGSGNGQAKLRELQVLEIRELHATGKWSYVELGEKYNVSHQTISRIVKKQTWSHI